MEFCIKCGGMILVKEGKSACAGCGKRYEKKPKMESSERIEKKESVVVIDEKAAETHPVVQMECPECKNKKAYFWTLQTRSSDEAETKFYKCVKCNHTWRKYR